MFCLKWFSIAWASLSFAVFVASYVMIYLKWYPLGIQPYDVRNTLKFWLLIAPGPAAAVIHMLLERAQQREAPRPRPGRSESGDD